MEHVIAQPFTNGVERLLSAMLGVGCRLVSERHPPGAGSVSGIITLSGPASVEVVLAFPVETATHIVAEMIGLDVGEVDEDIITDGVGEVANIVVGNAKAELAATRYAFQMSLPRVVASPDGDPVPERGEVTARHFDSDLGPFSMYVSLHPPPPGEPDR